MILKYAFPHALETDSSPLLEVMMPVFKELGEDDQFNALRTCRTHSGSGFDLKFGERSWEGSNFEATELRSHNSLVVSRVFDEGIRDQLRPMLESAIPRQRRTELKPGEEWARKHGRGWLKFYLENCWASMLLRDWYPQEKNSFFCEDDSNCTIM